MDENLNRQKLINKALINKAVRMQAKINVLYKYSIIATKNACVRKQYQFCRKRKRQFINRIDISRITHLIMIYLNYFALNLKYQAFNRTEN